MENNNPVSSTLVFLHLNTSHLEEYRTKQYILPLEVCHS